MLQSWKSSMIIDPGNHGDSMKQSHLASCSMTCFLLCLFLLRSSPLSPSSWQIIVKEKRTKEKTGAVRLKDLTNFWPTCQSQLTMSRAVAPPSREARWVGSGIWLGSHLDPSLLRHSWHVPPGRGSGEEPGHAEGSLFLTWPGDASGFPWNS